MADRAQVTSVEALEAFRARLILYLSKARPTLEEVDDEVQRTRSWLQNDRRNHWQNELRRRNRHLEEARQELFSARLSKLQEPTAAQQMAVTRAQRAVQEAEEKLQSLRKWGRDFENLTAPLVKQVDQLLFFVTADMQRAVTHLSQVITTLEAYTDNHKTPDAGRPGESVEFPSPALSGTLSPSDEERDGARGTVPETVVPETTDDAGPASPEGGAP